MPHWRPLATATSATAIAALFAIAITGGHSPFAATTAAQPVANEVAGETASPEVALVTDDPTPTADPATPGANPTAKSKPDGSSSRSGGGGSGSSSSSSSSGGGTAASAPTSKPTAKPTQKPDPTATATPRPDPTPAPVAQSGTLQVGDGEAGPRLSWTQCTSTRFAAYAVVRSLDSEIHFPAEDKDTVVALVTSAGSTSLTDSGAPNAKVYYAVWCLSRSDGEYKTIWKTPTVGYAP